MPGISDAELRRRLEAHNYSCPPITGSTKSTLIKKLSQLDQAQESKTRLKSSSASKPSKLFEYSSAEEDANTPTLRRRKNLGSATSSSQRKMATPSNGKSVSNTRKANLAPPPQSSSSSNGRHKSTLVQLSDEEDDDDQEDGKEDEEDSRKTSSEDDDDEDDDEDDDDEEEEEEVDTRNGRSNFGQQTSFNFDSSPLERSITNGSGKSPRFTNSTPINPRSTASYLNGHSSSHSKPPPPPTAVLFPPNSPLRRAVAKNKEAFGSLGEALASMSTSLNSPSSSSHESSTSSSSPISQVQQPTKYSDAAMDNAARMKKRTSSFRIEFVSVSKTIMILAVLFFALLAFKYVNLKPRIDIESKLKLCPPSLQTSKEHHYHHQMDCVPNDQLPMVFKLFEELVFVLERHSATVQCQSNQTDIGLSLSDILSELKDKYYPEMDAIEQLPSIPMIAAIEANPQWGIDMQRLEQNGEVILSCPQPPLDWFCWMTLQLGLLVGWSKLFVLCFVTLAVVVGIAYLCYRLYRWRSETLLREQQDVFELVEQVLSLLMKHHHHFTVHENSGGANHRLISRASVPVNHIRDQLILPQDRKRKRHIWSKVVKYIHDSESRVREDVQVLYGEEHKVWQWIPEVSWNPISHPGPNPYVAPMHVIASTTTTPTTQSPMLKSPMSPSSSNKWQGSAFNSINHNVAAPSVAPSCCLKVRQLFDQSIKTKGIHWVRFVSDEILNRCSSAYICHIAVDTESHEGCVYIKTKSTDDSAKVFKTLHGQWYRKNLVTCKFLRDERYVEKFPESKFHTSRMAPGYQVHVSQ